MLRRCRLAWTVTLAALGGCVATMPPPVRLAPMPAATLQERLGGEATLVVAGPVVAKGALLTPGLEPGSSGDLVVPLGAHLAWDVGGMATPWFGGLGTGLWVRGDTGETSAVGLRLGADLGTGDLAGGFPWAMPYAGPTLAGQFAHRGERPGAGFTVSWSVGVHALWRPGDPRYELVSSTGQVHPLTSFPQVYAAVDGAGRMPLRGSELALVIGGTLQLGVAEEVWPVPSLVVGLAL